MAKNKPDDVSAADADEALDKPVTRRELLAFCYANGILPAPPADATHSPAHAAVWDSASGPESKDESKPDAKKGHA